MVGDGENFTESKIVEREISHRECGLSFALKSLFEMVLGDRSCFTMCIVSKPTSIPTPISRPYHAQREGGDFDVPEDTPRVQKNIHAQFHENRFSSVAVHSEHTHRHTHTRPLL